MYPIQATNNDYVTSKLTNKIDRIYIIGFRWLKLISNEPEKRKIETIKKCI